MKTVLLGPKGQLRNDIRAINNEKGEPIAIRPVDCPEVNLGDRDAAAGILREQDLP